MYMQFAPVAQLDRVFGYEIYGRFVYKLLTKLNIAYSRWYLSWIECLATNQKVGGSNPFQRTKKPWNHLRFQGFFSFQNY